MNKKILPLVLSFVICVFAGCGGCGGPFPVKMTFTLDGKPIGDAVVALVPAADAKNPFPVEGKTAADGTITFKSGLEDGVHAGKYTITVNKIEEDWGKKGKPPEEQIASLKAKGITVKPTMKSVVPSKYTTADKSDLKVNIGYFSEKEFSFDLTSSQASPKSDK